MKGRPMPLPNEKSLLISRPGWWEKSQSSAYSGKILQLQGQGKIILQALRENQEIRYTGQSSHATLEAKRW